MDYTKVVKGYAGEDELYSDLFALADYRLYLAYKYHEWVGPDSRARAMLGLAVSQREFEHNLEKASLTGLMKLIDGDEREELKLNEETVDLRIGQTQAQIPLVGLLKRLNLGGFEKSCVITAFCAGIDKKYEKLFAYLQDDVAKKAPGVWFLAWLFSEGPSSFIKNVNAFGLNSVFTSLFDLRALEAGEAVLDGAVLGYLMGAKEFLAGAEIFDSDTGLEPMITGKDTAERLNALMKAGGAVCVTGEPGSGKRFQIKHLMKSMGARCLMVDARKAGGEALDKCAAIARVANAHLCIYNLDALADEKGAGPGLDGVAEALGAGKKLFLLSRGRVDCGFKCASVEIGPCKPGEVLALLKAYAGEAVKEGLLEEAAAKFKFTPRQAKDAMALSRSLAQAQGADLSPALLHRCCYGQVSHGLFRLAERVEPIYGWEDIVLPQKLKADVLQACAHIKYQNRVYDEWGFGKKCSSRGVSLLFAGPPGTGKTMCAQVMARELNMEMYKIQISQVVSKYVGETEKNLHEVFTEAQKCCGILFFDECDALFGKRSEVKDAHDRHANVEVAYLLQQMESFGGVCVLATNLLDNIDAAFMRRITYVARFPFPDAAMRMDLFKSMTPEATPLDGVIDYEFLAEKFELAGGNIKNVVLAAAFMAAAEGVALSMRHMLRSAVDELIKNDIIVVRESLSEYASLIWP